MAVSAEHEHVAETIADHDRLLRYGQRIGAAKVKLTLGKHAGFYWSSDSGREVDVNQRRAGLRIDGGRNHANLAF